MALRLVICALTLVVVAGCGSDDGDEGPERASNRESYALSPEEREQVEREQAAKTGRGRPAPTQERRHALLREVERSILRDARARVRTKELRGPIKSVECEPSLRTDAIWSCTAVTNKLEAADDDPDNPEVTGITGHPFRAVIHWKTGHYAWCKYKLVPGEGGVIDPRAIVPLPKECEA